MAFGTITSTSNTFGSVDGTTTGVIPGTLSGSVGVPGPQGPAGATGAQGPAGAAGVGVPAGGTAGQFLTKIDGTNYNTDWTTLNVSGKRDLTDYDFTNVADENLETFGLTLLPPSSATVIYDSFLTADALQLHADRPTSATGFEYESSLGKTSLTIKNREWVDDEGTIVPLAGLGISITPDFGIRFVDWSGTVQPSGFVQYGAGSITFSNSSVQTIAFPGFNNAALTGNPTAPTPATSDNDTSIATTAFVKAQGYAPLASPALTGNPTAPTAALGDNDTSIATTAFVKAQGYLTSAPVTSVAGKTGAVTLVVGDVSGAAPLASPVFTGDARAVTAALGDNDTSIATTAFVQQELASGTAVARNLEVQVRNQSGSTVPAGSIVYISGATGNLPLITLAQANNDANSAQTIGFVKTSIANNGTGYVIVRGVLEAIDTQALTEGVQLYLSPTTAGTWTTTKPSAPQHLVYVGIVIRSHPTLGTILVSVQNGYELHELHDVALASEANNDLLVYELSTDLWKNKSFATLGLATLNSPVFSGTPSLPTGTTAVTQSVNTNSTQIATTAFVRDMLMDPTYSVPPIASTITVTSGTGANYVNASPDFGYLVGPNANIAGFCQKQFQMFARSNSIYGFNFTRNIKVACKIALNWSSTLTAITQTLFFRLNTGTTNGTLSQIGFGISINLATKVLSILAHNGTTLTTKVTSWAVPSAGISSVDFMVESNGAGTVFAYADGVLIDSTTGMSTAANSGATTTALAQVEVNSAGGTSTGAATTYVCNLRAFVAHG